MYPVADLGMYLQVCSGSLVSLTLCLTGSKESVIPDYCLCGTMEPGVCIAVQTVDWETEAFLNTKRFGTLQQMLQVSEQTT